jgi:hypothetical protein
MGHGSFSHILHLLHCWRERRVLALISPTVPHNFCHTLQLPFLSTLNYLLSYLRARRSNETFGEIEEEKEGIDFEGAH